MGAAVAASSSAPRQRTQSTGPTVSNGGVGRGTGLAKVHATTGFTVFQVKVSSPDHMYALTNFHVIQALSIRNGHDPPLPVPPRSNSDAGSPSDQAPPVPRQRANTQESIHRAPSEPRRALAPIEQGRVLSSSESTKKRPPIRTPGTRVE